MSNYKKYQKERLHRERNEQRSSLSSPKLQISSKSDVDYYITLMDDPKTIIEGIKGLNDFCSKARIVIYYEQSEVFLRIFQNFSQNPEVIEQLFILIEKILQFEEPISSEVFSSDSFLQIFLANKDLTYSINSLYYIAKSYKYGAKSILDNLNEGTLLSIDSLLSVDSENLEMNIHFLSAFSQYGKDNDNDENRDFDKFISKIMSVIVEISQLNPRPSVRYECLSFIEYTLNFKSPSTIYEYFIYKKPFIESIFKIAPNSHNERILELKILNILQLKFQINKYGKKNEEEDNEEEEESFDDLNPASIVLSNNLLSFVSSCLKINIDEDPKDEELINFDVACYALDIIKEMASVGFESTNILFQNEIVQIAFELLSKGGHFYIYICSLMAILQIFLNSNIEQKNLIVKNHFFDMLSQIFEIIPSLCLVEVMNDLFEIIEISINEANSFLINSLFQNQSLTENFEELSMDDDEPASSIAQKILLKAKCLSEGSSENSV